MSRADWSLEQWLEHQLALHPQSIALGLERVQAVRARLQLERLAPLQINVGGTNGKGSISTLLAATLQRAGYAVGVYRSPHLIDYRERIQLLGQYVDQDRLIRAFEAVEAARGTLPLTYFEFGTLAAAEVFRSARLDAVVLEVGLGGRLDAVNAFDPDAAVLSTVDLDHTEYLGHTREAIGAEKAAIFRPGCPAVLGDPRPVASVAQYARAIGAEWIAAGQHYRFAIGADGWRWSGWTGQFDLPRPALAGDWQVQNAAAAVAVLEALAPRWPRSVEHYAAGLESSWLPGRMQRIATSPEIVLDVAHNPEAVAALAHWLESAPQRSTRAVFGALRDKDPLAMVARLAPRIERWYFAGLDAESPRGLATAELRARLEALPLPPDRVAWLPDPVSALAHAQAESGPGDRILAYGSFHLVAPLLRYWRGDRPPTGSRA